MKMIPGKLYLIIKNCYSPKFEIPRGSIVMCTDFKDKSRFPPYHDKHYGYLTVLHGMKTMRSHVKIEKLHEYFEEIV